MDRAERWRIVLEKLKIIVPKEYQCYIQFKNNLLNDSELDANVPWLNIVNLITSNDSWSHLLFLKYFININPKPDLIIKDTLNDILKDTNTSVCRNYSFDKLLSLEGTKEGLKISKFIINSIEKGVLNLSNLELINYQESTNLIRSEKDKEIERKFILDPVGDAFVTIINYFTQKHKNLIENQMELMMDIIKNGNKLIYLYDWFKNQYNITKEIHKLLFGNWKEILSKIKEYQNKSTMPSELFIDDFDFTPKECKIIKYSDSDFNKYKYMEYNKIRNNSADNKNKGNIKFNKITKSRINLNIYENQLDELIYKNNKILKWQIRKIMLENDLMQMENMQIQENQLFVWIIQNKYQLIQEYINKKKIKMENYNKDVQEKLKWLVKNGYINKLE
jgi:hypothetical protein